MRFASEPLQGAHGYTCAAGDLSFGDVDLTIRHAPRMGWVMGHADRVHVPDSAA